jgi:hypothetical protein
MTEESRPVGMERIKKMPSSTHALLKSSAAFAVCTFFYFIEDIWKATSGSASVNVVAVVNSMGEEISNFSRPVKVVPVVDRWINEVF